MRTQLFASSKRAPFSDCVVANRGRIFRVCDFGSTHFFIFKETLKWTALGLMNGKIPLQV